MLLRFDDTFCLQIQSVAYEIRKIIIVMYEITRRHGIKQSRLKKLYLFKAFIFRLIELLAVRLFVVNGCPRALLH